MGTAYRCLCSTDHDAFFIQFCWCLHSCLCLRPDECYKFLLSLSFFTSPSLPLPGDCCPIPLQMVLILPKDRQDLVELGYNSVSFVFSSCYSTPCLRNFLSSWHIGWAYPVHFKLFVNTNVFCFFVFFFNPVFYYKNNVITLSKTYFIFDSIISNVKTNFSEVLFCV